MRVVSFYSFKGGVGRSSLVLNVAYSLARRGHLVVMADWDLHAPGLTIRPELAMQDGPGVRKGILEFLTSALGEGENEEVEVIDPYQLAQPTRLATHERQQDATSFTGDLYFIPAGAFLPNREDTYHELLRRIQLPALASWRAAVPDGRDEQSVLGFFRQRIEKVRSPAMGDHPPDFLLLDARTGLTEIGDLLLDQLVDHYVVVFGLNDQNLLGMELTLQKVQQVVPIGNLTNHLTLVASPVPLGEEDLQRERFEHLSRRLESLARPEPRRPESREVMPEVLRIPYHPRLALTEEITVARYQGSSLALAYEAVTDHLRQLDRSIEQTLPLIGKQVMAEVPREPGKEEQAGASASEVPGERLVRQVSPPAPIIQAAAPLNRAAGPAPEPSPYDSLPSWNWAFPALEAASVLPGEPREVRLKLLELLAWSISLSKEEKERLLGQGASLTLAQISQMIEFLTKERNSLRASWNREWARLQGLHASHLVDWVELLAALSKADLEKVWQRVNADQNNRVLSRELGGSRRFLLLLAQALLGRNPQGAAAALARRVCQDWPADHLMAGRAGELRRRLEEGSDASIQVAELAALLAGTQTDHAVPLTLIGAAAAAAQAGWTDVVEQCTADAIAQQPEDASLWLRRGQLLGQLNLPVEAESAYRRAVDLEPTNHQSWMALGLLMLNDPERHSEAEAAFRQATECNPNNGWSWNNLGVILAEDPARSHDAEQAYRRAIQCGNAMGAPWHNLGRLLAKDFLRFQEAESAFKMALSVDPQDPRNINYRLGLADFYASLPHRHDQAVALLVSVEALPSADPNVWNTQAMIYADRLQRHDEAKVAMQKAIEIAPDVAVVRLNAADFALQRGDVADAVTHLDRAEPTLDDRARLALATLRLAIALGEGNRQVSLEHAKQLADRGTTSKVRYPSYVFQTLLDRLRERGLAPSSLVLLESAARLTRGEIDVPAFQAAITAWLGSEADRPTDTSAP